MACVAILLGSGVAFVAGLRVATPPSVVAVAMVAPAPPELVPMASWTSLGNRTEAVAGHGFVYDSKAGVFVLFGGRNETTGFRDATWSYNATTDTWTNITPAVSPSPRANFGMVYDSRADRVILFGGLTAEGLNNETWVFNPTKRTWTQRVPSVSPSARSGVSMAYDAESDRTILYGGSRNVLDVCDTWAYRYASDTWTKMAPADSPGVIGLASMTYVPSAGRIILFGGYTMYGWSDYWWDRTWAYDYANDTWTDLKPAVHPSGRGGSAMSFDSSSGQVLLFGGTAGSWLFSHVFNETWAYDYERNNWTIATPAVGPSARSYAAMDFDPVAGRAVLVGGSRDGSWGQGENDAWVYRYGAAPPAVARNLFAPWVWMGPSPDHVTLTWEAPYSDGGSAVANYTIYRGEAPGSESLLLTLGPVLTYTDRAVTLGTEECYRVAAVNAIGTGQRSNEVCAIPADLPSAPRGLVATPGLSRVTLTWQAPLSTGGLDVFGYFVYRGPQGDESPVADMVHTCTFEDTAVTNGETVYYRVAAVNAVGQGPMSNEASATAPTTPSAPEALVAIGGDRLVELTWAAPSSTGGMEVTGYRVYRGEDTGHETLFATLAVMYSFTDGAVTNGRAYHYRVSALNAVGEGAPSDQVTVTPARLADIVPPTIAIASPAEGAVLASTAATVTGVALDNVAVQKVELSTDRVTWTTATGTTSWTGNLTLHEGQNTVYARATDTSGNTRLASASVTVETPSVQGSEGLNLAPVGLGLVVVVASLATGIVLWRRRANGRRPAS